MGGNNKDGEYRPENYVIPAKKKNVPAPIVNENLEQKAARRAAVQKLRRKEGALLRRSQYTQANAAGEEADKIPQGLVTRLKGRDARMEGFRRNDSGEHTDES